VKSPRHNRLIGIDLDNTLVCYDDLFHIAAREERLIKPSLPKSKEKIRDAIRLLPDGEARWTRLQAIVYGPRMGGAELFQGAGDFLRRCAAGGVRTVIVSHKTRFAALDGVRVDLRRSALQWLETAGFFSEFGLSRRDVFFESTREGKIKRVQALRCTDFIDDLVEVFAGGAFPPRTRQLLFAPHGAPFPGSGAPPLIFTSWGQLEHFFFDDARP
jgi:hypothetical protein